MDEEQATTEMDEVAEKDGVNNHEDCERQQTKSRRSVRKLRPAGRMRMRFRNVSYSFNRTLHHSMNKSLTKSTLLRNNRTLARALAQCRKEKSKQDEIIARLEAMNFDLNLQMTRMKEEWRRNSARIEKETLEYHKDKISRIKLTFNELTSGVSDIVCLMDAASSILDERRESSVSDTDDCPLSYAPMRAPVYDSKVRYAFRDLTNQPITESERVPIEESSASIQANQLTTNVAEKIYDMSVIFENSVEQCNAESGSDEDIASDLERSLKCASSDEHNKSLQTKYESRRSARRLSSAKRVSFALQSEDSVTSVNVEDERHNENETEAMAKIDDCVSLQQPCGSASEADKSPVISQAIFDTFSIATDKTAAKITKTNPKRGTFVVLNSQQNAPWPPDESLVTVRNSYKRSSNCCSDVDYNLEEITTERLSATPVVVLHDISKTKTPKKSIENQEEKSKTKTPKKSIENQEEKSKTKTPKKSIENQEEKSDATNINLTDMELTTVLGSVIQTELTYNADCAVEDTNKLDENTRNHKKRKTTNKKSMRKSKKSHGATSESAFGKENEHENQFDCLNEMVEPVKAEDNYQVEKNKIGKKLRMKKEPVTPDNKATKDVENQQEPVVRARRTLAVNYVLPKLNSKLRQGDKYTDGNTVPSLPKKSVKRVSFPEGLVLNQCTNF